MDNSNKDSATIGIDSLVSAVEGTGVPTQATDMHSVPSALAHRCPDTELDGLQQLLKDLESNQRDTDYTEESANSLGPVGYEDATVVFLDLEAHTELVRGSKPADVIVTLNEIFAAFREVCARREVTVNQYLGDGLMAFARGPRHASRAVAAALEWHERVEQLNCDRRVHAQRNVRLRIGISSGLVVFGNIGTCDKMDFTAVGPPTNLAARLQQAAAPGSVCISTETYRLVQQEFVVGPPRRESLKGFGPRMIWDVVAAIPLDSVSPSHPS